MLGLDPLPPREDLKAVTVGKVDHPEFSVERVHFQSSPGLYVTANLYVPKKRSAPLPAILYVCGHKVMREGKVSLGNKTGYQHHPAWFARNGFVCLAVDTIQLGEIPGLHHGTHNLNQWWWNSRGYTPAGVETWNGIRALDYLQSRPEVDGSRLGITGRSGGGATSWFVAAADVRIKAAVPVAGITDLRNHLVDGVVDGHCDCMFHVNSLRWDFSKLAALISPRALLIGNTDKDPIFPLNGVLRVHESAAAFYSAVGAAKNLGILLAEGSHEDVQELQVGAFRWFKRFLADENDNEVVPSKKFFTPAELRVFESLPSDERASRAHEWFVPKADPASFPSTPQDWKGSAPELIAKIRATSFSNWPEAGAASALEHLSTETGEKGALAHFVVPEGAHTGGDSHLVVWGEKEKVDAFVKRAASRGSGTASGGGPEAAGGPVSPVLEVLDTQDLGARLAAARTREAVPGAGLVFWFAPRGMAAVEGTRVSPTPWTSDPKDLTRIRRRFMLTGQTLDAWRVHDIVRVSAALRATGIARLERLEAAGPQAVNALYASLFAEGIQSLRLAKLPPSLETTGAPDYFSILRVCDLPQALELARTRTSVETSDPGQ